MDKGSRKNKFAFSSVETPVWQGEKVLEYQDISNFRNATRQDASALENVKLFLREPKALRKALIRIMVYLVNTV